MMDPLFLAAVTIWLGDISEFRRPDGTLLGLGMAGDPGTGKDLTDDGTGAAEDGTGAAEDGTGSEGTETRIEEMETLVTVTVMDVVGGELKRAVFVRSCLQSSRTSQSSSLLVNPALVDPIQMQLVDVVDDDNSADDDFACPLARVLQPVGLAAQTDACTGWVMVFMQGQSQRQ